MIQYLFGVCIPCYMQLSEVNKSCGTRSNSKLVPMGSSQYLHAQQFHNIVRHSQAQDFHSAKEVQCPTIYCTRPQTCWRRISCQKDTFVDEYSQAQACHSVQWDTDEIPDLVPSNDEEAVPQLVSSDVEDVSAISGDYYVRRLAARKDNHC